jgi:hypothetical protein
LSPLTCATRESPDATISGDATVRHVVCSSLAPSRKRKRSSIRYFATEFFGRGQRNSQREEFKRWTRTATNGSLGTCVSSDRMGTGRATVRVVAACAEGVCAGFGIRVANGEVVTVERLATARWGGEASASIGNRALKPGPMIAIRSCTGMVRSASTTNSSFFFSLGASATSLIALMLEPASIFNFSAHSVRFVRETEPVRGSLSPLGASICSLPGSTAMGDVAVPSSRTLVRSPPAPASVICPTKSRASSGRKATSIVSVFPELTR